MNRFIKCIHLINEEHVIKFLYTPDPNKTY